MRKTASKCAVYSVVMPPSYVDDGAMPTPSPAYAFDPASVALGNAIHRARKAFGISQEELAHRAEIDRSHMGSIEGGKQNPTLIVLVRIAYAMDIALVDLFDLAGI